MSDSPQRTRATVARADIAVAEEVLLTRVGSLETTVHVLRLEVRSLRGKVDAVATTFSKELRDVETTLRAEMRAGDAEIKASLEGLWAEIHAGDAETHRDIMRAEMHAGDASLRTEIGSVRAEVGSVRTDSAPGCSVC